MGVPFTTTRRVEFCDTDAAAIAHFSAFFRYMEQAEHDLLRSLGTSVAVALGDGWHLSWPRVHVECDYRGAVRFEDVLTIEVSILKLGTKSVTYGFRFTVAGARETPTVVAEGKTVAVCCRVKPGEPLQSTAVPTTLIDGLRRFVVDPDNSD